MLHSPGRLNIRNKVNACLMQYKLHGGSFEHCPKATNAVQLVPEGLGNFKDLCRPFT